MTMGHSSTVLALAAALAQGQSPHAHHAPTPTVVEGGWVKYQHTTAKFSLEHPADWRVGPSKGTASIHISHPTKPAHLFASAFTMSESSLREFAEMKFGVQAEIFKPVAPARSVDGVGWSGLMQEAEATQNGERAWRRMLCAEHEGLYVSLTLYIDPKELREHEKDYERLFASLRFETEAATSVSTLAPR